MTKKSANNIILVLFILFAFHNGLVTLKDYQKILKDKSPKTEKTGREFLDIKPFLEGVEKVGYLTNWYLTSESYETAYLLAAQYALAPAMLDVGNPNHEFVILDCISLIPAFDFMQKYQLTPVYINEYQKVLAKKE